MSWRDLDNCHNEKSFLRKFHLCGLVSQADMQLIEENKEIQMRLSYFDIEMAFDDRTISDHFLEVIIFTPQELHHLFEPGIVPYILSAIRETIDEKSRNESTKNC